MAGSSGLGMPHPNGTELKPVGFRGDGCGSTPAKRSEWSHFFARRPGPVAIAKDLGRTQECLPSRRIGR